MKRRRGSTLVESALALLSFAVLMAGIMEAGFLMFAANAVTFAAQRTARYASVCGSSSGRPMVTQDVQTMAQNNAAPLTGVTANVTWSDPGHVPGSTIKVQVVYSIKPEILPIDGSILTLQSTSLATIVQ
jgi:Flp pilus assembly protein TadG